MGVRFVHAADLHLGSPLEAVGAESTQLQEQLRDASYTAFERIIDLALDEAVDFLLIAGDIYDQKSRSVRAEEFLAAQLRRLHEAAIPVYLIYGNHDPLGAATTYVEFPPNVSEFGHDEPEEHVFSADSTPTARIWGQSYRTEAESRKMHRDFDPADTSIPNIGMLHTGLTPEDSQYVPCSSAELAELTKFDYWALGHIHSPTIYDTDPPILHPGVPQGRHVGEPGPGGCVLVELDDSGDAELEYVPTSPIIWDVHEVSVDPDESADFDLTTIDGLQRYITEHADSLSAERPDLDPQLPIPSRQPQWDPDGYICRWRLTGHGEAYELLNSADEDVLDRLTTRLRDGIKQTSPFVYTERVVDRTRPPLGDVDELRDDDRVVSEFFDLIDNFETRPGSRVALMETLDYDKSSTIWERVEDPEAVSDDRLALTEDRFDELFERAQHRVLDELLRRRAE